MTVINPNLNFPDKNKNNQRKIVKYGSVLNSSVKWGYDLRPVIKWALIFLSAFIVGWISYYFIEKNVEKVRIQTGQIEAEEARKQYLQRRLESIKKERIAEAQKQELLSK